MQKWPYADFTHVNVAHIRSAPKKNASAQMWEHLIVEAVFVSEHIVQFFDHYTKEYKSRRSELDAYLEKLDTDRWTLTVAGNLVTGKGYQFRRYQFRRVTE